MTDRPRLFYGYIVVGAAFVIQMMTWGIYNSYGVFFNAMLDEFGWSRATLSGAAALSQFLVGVGAVFLGRLNDRFGPRILMVYVGLAAGLGYFLMSGTGSIWQLYLFQGFIVGIGLSGTDVILLSTAARWFKRRRGLVSGVVKMGTGLGFLVMPLIINWLITDWSWRTAYAVCGVAMAVIIVAAGQLLRRDPARMNLLPDGAAVLRPEDVTAAESGSTLREAVRTVRFWLVCLVHFGAYFMTFSMVVHFAPYAVDKGQTEATAAVLVSMVGGASIAGRLLMGLLNDKIGSQRATAFCLGLFTAAFAWLQGASALWMLGLFAVVYGFCHGGIYSLMSPLVAEFFGLRAHGTIFGICVFAGGLGGAIGPVIIGRLYDAQGDYRAGFLMVLAAAAASLVAVLLAGRTKAAEGTGDTPQW